MIGGPTIASQKSKVRVLADAAARDCIGRTFRYGAIYRQTASGGALNGPNLLIMQGKPEEAVEKLTELAQSPFPTLAPKAAPTLR
jgi:D-alanyl-D-alanine carboxypeptidase